jgi:hypothetical protein
MRYIHGRSSSPAGGSMNPVYLLDQDFRFVLLLREGNPTPDAM